MLFTFLAILMVSEFSQEHGEEYISPFDSGIPEYEEKFKILITSSFQQFNTVYGGREEEVIAVMKMWGLSTHFFILLLIVQVAFVKSLLLTNAKYSEKELQLSLEQHSLNCTGPRI